MKRICSIIILLNLTVSLVMIFLLIADKNVFATPEIGNKFQAEDTNINLIGGPMMSKVKEVHNLKETYALFNKFKIERNIKCNKDWTKGVEKPFDNHFETSFNEFREKNTKWIKDLEVDDPFIGDELDSTDTKEEANDSKEINASPDESEGRRNVKSIEDWTEGVDDPFIRDQLDGTDTKEEANDSKEINASPDESEGRRNIKSIEDWTEGVDDPFIRDQLDSDDDLVNKTEEDQVDQVVKDSALVSNDESRSKIRKKRSVTAQITPEMQKSESEAGDIKRQDTDHADLTKNSHNSNKDDKEIHDLHDLDSPIDVSPDMKVDTNNPVNNDSNDDNTAFVENGIDTDEDNTSVSSKDSDSPTTKNDNCDNNKDSQDSSSIVVNDKSSNITENNNKNQKITSNNIRDIDNNITNINNHNNTDLQHKHQLHEYLSIFDSNDYIISQRVLSRLTACTLADAVNTMEHSRQMVVSSGDVVSHVQHEMWVMPFINEARRYTDNKHKISACGINIGWDAEIMHRDSKVESLFGIILGFYNSRMERTVLDNIKYNTTLNTQIVSLYYSILFDHKAFIYILLSSAISNPRYKSCSSETYRTTNSQLESLQKHNIYRHAAEIHTGYNLPLYSNYVYKKHVLLVPIVGVQFNSISSNSTMIEHYSSLQHAKLSCGIKVEYHSGMSSCTNVTAALHGFVSYRIWNDATTSSNECCTPKYNVNMMTDDHSSIMYFDKLSYNAGVEVSLEHKRMIWSVKYDVTIAQKYLSQQLALKIKIKL